MRIVFKTEEEARKYLAHDRIECLECLEQKGESKRYLNLYAHLPQAHGIDSKEYMIRHNIPPWLVLRGGHPQPDTPRERAIVAKDFPVISNTELAKLLQLKVDELRRIPPDDPGFSKAKLLTEMITGLLTFLD